MNSPSSGIRGRRGALASAVLALLLVLPGFSARAEQPAAESARDKLNSLTEQIAAVNAERNSLDAELNALLANIATQQADVRALQAGADAARQRVASLEASLSSRQEALNERAAEVYMTPPVSLLDVFLGAQSLRDADDALYFMAEAARSDEDLILQLDAERTSWRSEQARLEDLQNQARAALAQMNQLAADLGDRLARQRTLADQLATDLAEAAGLVAQLSEAKGPSPSPKPTPTPTPSPLPPDPGPDAVKAFIASYFAPLGQKQVDIAMCVAQAESGFDPHALNPETGAAGVFQFIPTTWAALSEAAGWGGSSVFDAEANVAVAAWTVDHSGWGGWPVAKSCGA